MKDTDQKTGQQEATLEILKTIGSGLQSVYAYHYPSQEVDSGPYPIKIGSTKKDVQGRILETQSAMQEKPVIDLIILCDDAAFTERYIHSVLACRRMNNSFGREWFTTTPYEVEMCYNDIDDVSSMNVGQQIRYFRHRHGYSQTRLASMSGLRQATISQIENNSDSASVKTLRAISRAMGTIIIIS